jgi:hypothetical protein
LKGYKVSGPRGPEWRIFIESTEDTTSQVSASSDDTTQVAKDVALRALTSSEDTTLTTDDATIIELLSSDDITENSPVSTLERFPFPDFFKEEASLAPPQPSVEAVADPVQTQLFPTLERLVTSLEKKDVVIESQAQRAT